ncbi:MAG: hypothetical protein ACM3U2_16530 [Deltaproteobacteria bacterium]
MTIGHNDPTQVKTATLVMLAPSLQETYLTFTLHNIGIFRLDPLSLDPAGPGGINSLPMMRAEMHVNQPDLEFPNERMDRSGGLDPQRWLDDCAAPGLPGHSASADRSN